ncbi:MAG: VOC family protein [Microbacterium sp.]|uniref:VOC family protein n=1 Tax=Microbacterium sp. TaxID=51671 RepID=UPI001AC5C7BF|nr:VOC family protein [Microbacterium sp.]MBN9173953.1 VOC family protein [Microbacterium sp.]
MTILNPYLSFKDDAREAMEFYRSVFGGELTLSTFGEFPGMVQDPAENELVMHAQLTTADGLTLMGSDTPAHMAFERPANISLSLSGDDEGVLQGYWNALAEGGTVTMPFETPPWGGKFGMLVDKYGFSWMIAANAAS